MTKYVFKITELTGWKYVKLPLKNSALLNNENVDKYCSSLSILTNLHPCQNSQPNRVSSFRQDFDELNIGGLYFTNRFECSHVHKFWTLNTMSINVFEIRFRQEQKKWKQKISHWIY